MSAVNRLLARYVKGDPRTLEAEMERNARVVRATDPMLARAGSVHLMKGRTITREDVDARLEKLTRV